ncbi:MAG: hypothetical protein JRI55_40025, partial [Deltaproteobacteria bacterium]|nr:hypothetical protein [Deltaproteobacteria bacterium]
DIFEVIELGPGTAGSHPDELTAMGGRLYFEANDGTAGTQLWEYDGSESPSLGTAIRQVTINGSGSAHPGALSVFNNRLVFHADDGVNGRELWTLYIK